MIPLSWYPRLIHATKEERENWEILGDGYAIAWDDLDEHIGIEGLLAGKSSGESDRSFQRWLTTKITFSNITQNNNQNIQGILNSLEFLEKEIQVFPEEEKQEALVYLDQLKTEIRGKQNPVKIRTFLKGFFGIALPLIGLIANSTGFLNDATDLATKFNVTIPQSSLPLE